MSEKPLAPAGAMLGALETVEACFKSKTKDLPLGLLCFRFTFERISIYECRIKVYFQEKLFREFVGCDLLKEIDRMETELFEIMNPIVDVYQRAASRDVEIKLTKIGNTRVQESSPPQFCNLWKINVGDYTKTEEAYDPRISLILAAGKEAPLLAK